MKLTKKVLPTISLLLASMLGASAIAQELVEVKPAMEVLHKIPQSAHFDLQEIENDQYQLVGRLNIQRRFLGTRATPPYQDVVQFHCFNGDELKFSSFTDDKLEKNLLKILANGHSLPVVMTVRFERKRVGHDGINMSERLLAHVEACQPATAESIVTAAKASQFDATAAENYLEALNPDLVKDRIAISLGKIYVRSKVSPRASAFSIHGIRVFNTSSDRVSIEIIEVTIEQESVTQHCQPSNRSKSPQSWQVAPNSWSDGIYEQGKMPRVLWMFDPAKPIKPEKKVTIKLKLKLNKSEVLTLERTVDTI
ncbi:MAG: hypothetical protein ACSHX6_15885 [Akkermansiaceae bacterium]